MSKIIRAINSMIANSDEITDILKGKAGNEIFFIYKKKYKWSIVEGENEYFLHYFPLDDSLELLANLDDWTGITLITYKSGEFKSREAEESFRELYYKVKEKIYDVDKVLDDIIGDDKDEEPF